MKKNILISVYDMEIGGIERSLINMLESFDYDRYKVDLFICNHAGDFMSLIPKQVHVLPQIHNYSVYRKPILQCIKEGHYSTSIIRVLCKYIAKIKALFRNLKEGSGYIQMQLVSKYTSYWMPKIAQKYDLAISYAWPHDLIAQKVTADRKIAWIHTDYSELEIDNKLDLNVWNKFDSIAAVSEACSSSFLTVYPSLEKKVIVVENITSPAFIKKMAAETNSIPKNTAEAFHIVSVGRLSFVKGFDMAVEALKKLHVKGYTNIKWYVIGYGGYENELKQIIAGFKLEDSFILLGKQTNPYPYIQACDLYVQPSRYEGKAVTVTEAQILGKPILITNYPTAKSQVEDGVDGYICELSVDGIVEGVQKFVENDELRRTLTDRIKDKDYSNTFELDKLYEIMEDVRLSKGVI
ncbi:glycosyltransferase [Paenibacillus radicis (ex Xue et al. 2023)]|uniref:Glycosyltransferase n=1 Tax=Paenibacillus radicis (ex Xue et al. 2023) TaxID=2972489 RepID=A0ABT1YQC9_9BACL|nr:glycosyltransferase [Paenibacillus radicis (ex Xue et al. 2023)]MCR8635388.1 glycosyltransferase [Paenibacillus radicis (ex Xue et al. 2023)]